MKTKHIDVDIFDVKRDYNYITTLDFTGEIEDIDYDTEYFSRQISEEYMPYKLIEIVWYFSNGLRISYEIKNGIIYKTERYYE